MRKCGCGRFSALFLFLALLCGCASAPSDDLLYYKSVSAEWYAPDRELPSSEPRDNVNGDDPDDVYVKSLSQTFLKGYRFVLKNGKIWCAKEGKDGWELFLGTGLPFARKKGAFDSPSSISEIFADGDCLFAFDDRGRMYYVYTQKLPDEKIWDWRNVFGWPDKRVLRQNGLVRNKRGWAMGVRRKDILWYEDRFANQHHYGTMGLATLYFLSEDGQTIFFTDSGMPVDFSNRIQGPEHGSFVARSIGCSGSTIFLIADDGTMYTRLIDFDTMGCDPMFFKYTYRKLPQKWTGKDYLSNYSPWALPAEDWKREPAIPLFGKARLSRFISIHQNGQGNFARELRVAGIDPYGNEGYYFKQISSDEWQFRRAPLSIREGDFLSGKTERGMPTEFDFSGIFFDGGKTDETVSCSVSGFDIASEGESTLTFTMERDGWKETASFTVYTVEMWTYMVRYNPGFDGTPKQFFCTVVSPPETLETEHEEFGNFLKGLFGSIDRKVFALSCEASSEYAYIAGKRADGSEWYAVMGAGGNVIHPSEFAVQSIAGFYRDEGILLDPAKEFSAADIPEIERKIDANKKFISYMKGELESYEIRKESTNRFYRTYSVVDFITTITLLNKIDFPKIKTMTSFGDRLVGTNAENFRNMYEYRSANYPSLIELTERRVENYEAVLNALRGGAKSAKCGAFLMDSFPQYFSAAGIPSFLDGISPSVSQTAVLKILGDEPFLSAFMLESCSGGNERAVVSVSGSSYAIRSALSASTSLGVPLSDYLSEHPIELDAHFLAVEGGGFLRKTFGVKSLQQKKGKFVWDGTALRITAENSVFPDNVIFESARCPDSAKKVRSQK